MSSWDYDSDERYTGIRAEWNATGMRDAYGMRPENVWRVTVRGTGGSFHGTRASLAEARATARHYARLFDAPCEVI
jgi:hypothetical protein